MKKELYLLLKEVTFGWLVFQVGILEALEYLLDPIHVSTDVLAEDNEVIEV